MHQIPSVAYLFYLCDNKYVLFSKLIIESERKLKFNLGKNRLLAHTTHLSHFFAILQKKKCRPCEVTLPQS